MRSCFYINTTKIERKNAEKMTGYENLQGELLLSVTSKMRVKAVFNG